MGTFRVTIEIGDPTGSRYREMSALVDTGASYTALPGSLLQELGVVPLERWPFRLADRRQIERDVGETRVRLDGRVRTTIVVFGDEGTDPLLGVVTLEEFRLGVDPVGQRLIPVPGLLMTLGKGYKA